MASQYAPKTFIRQVRGALLNRCLRRHGIDLDLNIEIIKPAVVETIFQKLMSLPSDQLQVVEKDFATITELASPAGVEALLEQARLRGEEHKKGHFSYSDPSAREFNLQAQHRAGILRTGSWAHEK